MALPEQYVTGCAYFMDFAFTVNCDTLIPRPETELLVERALEIAGSEQESGDYRILDIGTGCGNIAISLTKYLRHSKIIALDISHNALRTAYTNADGMGVSDRIVFLQSDVFQAVMKEKVFDMIVTNPPYVSARDMETLPSEVRAEPREALYGGEDGLGMYRTIVSQAREYMKTGGTLLMEVGYDQSGAVRKLLHEHCYTGIRVMKDHSGIERIVEAVNG